MFGNNGNWMKLGKEDLIMVASNLHRYAKQMSEYSLVIWITIINEYLVQKINTF
jgi:hypothetical protein